MGPLLEHSNIDHYQLLIWIVFNSNDDTSKTEVLKAIVVNCANSSAHGVAMKRKPKSQVNLRSAFTLFELMVVVGILSLLTGLAMVAIQAVREAARRSACQNNLRQIWLGISNYEASRHTLPGATFPAYSLFVTILPYMEQDSLFHSLDFNEMHPPGYVFPEGPDYLRCPVDLNYEFTRGNPRNTTSYLGNVGTAWLLGTDNGVFSTSRTTTTAEIYDGLSNTMALAEFAQGSKSNRVRGIDGHPRGMTIRLFDELLASAPAVSIDGQIGFDWCLNGLSSAYYTHYFPPGKHSGYLKRTNYEHGAFTPSSNHPNQIQSVRADGSVHSVSYSIDRTLWVQLGDRNDGGRSPF
jgi:prepilin-type N-terminal cleavage/methylation domain-containing protein